jgi:hypothetical protein
MAEPSTPPSSSGGGGFVDLMWQMTALFFMLYLLARWLMPSVLPHVMIHSSCFDPKIVVICAIPGAMWAGLSLLIRAGN